MIKIFHGDDRAEDQVVPWQSKVLRGAFDRGINLRAAKLSLKTSSKFYVVVEVRIYPLRGRELRPQAAHPLPQTDPAPWCAQKL